MHFDRLGSWDASRCRDDGYLPPTCRQQVMPQSTDILLIKLKFGLEPEPPDVSLVTLLS